MGNLPDAQDMLYELDRICARLSLAERILDAYGLPHEALEALARGRTTGTRIQGHGGEIVEIRTTLVQAHEKRFLFSGGD